MSAYDTLCLAGGGVKGFAILGAIQACIDLEMFKKLNIYIGTSIGAVICYLLAIGYTPIEIVVYIHINKCFEKVMENKNLNGITSGNGVLDYSFINDSLEKITLEKIGMLLTLGKLKEKFGKTLICTTYNMTVCTVEHLGPDNYPDLPCLTALRMSCNVPIVFDRFKYMDNFYIDGGVIENFSIKKACEIGKKVLGINFIINENLLKDEPSQGMLFYILKLLYTQMVTLSKLSISNIKEKCDVVNISDKLGTNFLDLNVDYKIRLEMFSDGYDCVKNFNKKIK